MGGGRGGQGTKAVEKAMDRPWAGMWGGMLDHAYSLTQVWASFHHPALDLRGELITLSLGVGRIQLLLDSCWGMGEWWEKGGMYT